MSPSGSFPLTHPPTHSVQLTTDPRYSPFALTCWENHPFTLVHWKQAQDSEPATPTSPPGSPKTLLAAHAAAPDLSAAADRYTLLIRPYTGYTARLRRRLLLAHAHAGPAPVARFLLEGPYGRGPAALGRFSDVWLFVGGSGVSVAVSSIYAALGRGAPRIRLVWSCRRAGLMAAVLRRELAAAARCASVSFDLYVTGEGASAAEEGKAGWVAALAAGGVRRRRPDIPLLMRAAAEQAGGALAVVVCGPASLTDDARAAFCDEMGRIGKRRDMELFVESFNW